MRDGSEGNEHARRHFAQERDFRIGKKRPLTTKNGTAAGINNVNYATNFRK